MQVEIILYVKNQTQSKEFYQTLLGTTAIVDLPGMTEYQLSRECKLGLMSIDSISKIICPQLPNPGKADGIPKCELYLLVKNVIEYYNRGLEMHANLIDDLKPRDWGHQVCYFSDPDGHVIAFAEEIY